MALIAEYPARTKVKMTYVSQPCRKCGAPVEKVERDSRKRYKDGQTFAFSWWLRCPKCRVSYMIPSAQYPVPEQKRTPTLVNTLFGVEEL